MDQGDLEPLAGQSVHLGPEGGLAEAVRRSGDGDHQIGALRRKLLHRVDGVASTPPVEPVVPEVFADRDGQPAAAKATQLNGIGGLKVPGLIEDVVGRQQRLEMTGEKLASIDERRGVIEPLASLVASPLDVADQDTRLTLRGRCRDDVVQGLEVGVDEPRVIEQILGRVARDGELGQNEELGAVAPRVLEALQHFLLVPVDRSNGGVDLCQRDLHNSYQLSAISYQLQALIPQRWVSLSPRALISSQLLA